MNLKLITQVICIFGITCSATLFAESPFEFTTKSPIYVVGDVHGAHHEVSTSLRTVGLIDADDNWIGGSSHFVSLGDLMDRGPSTRKVLDLYMKLQTQAVEAGGRFHVILGNHEVMNLTGDLRYVSRDEYAEHAIDETLEIRSKAYRKFLKSKFIKDSAINLESFNSLYPSGYFAHRSAYSAKGKYGKWLLAQPFVIMINDQIFAHGGLSTKLIGTNVEALNDVMKSSLKNYLYSWKKLRDKNYQLFDVSFGKRPEAVKYLDDSKWKKKFIAVNQQLLFTNDTPTWYRGNAICHPLYEKGRLNNTLASFNAKRLWVGHTPTASRTPNHRHDGALIMMDTGMLKKYYLGRPWVAKITSDNKVSYIDGLTGTSTSSVRAPNRASRLAYGMSEQEMEEFLQTADIVELGRPEYGITKPIIIKLLKNGREVKAIYKYFDDFPKAHKQKWTKKKELADRYHFEMAAYTLDRMLGIGLVPTTVERKYRGRDGIIQVWVNGLVSRAVMDKKKVEYLGYCDERAQRNMLNTWDYLIRNTDRNHSNMLYTTDDWQVWFIDHSRTFGTGTKQLRSERDWKTIHPTQAFKDILKTISRDDLKVLRPWLHRVQVNALWKRRNKIIDGYFDEK